MPFSRCISFIATNSTRNYAFPQFLLQRNSLNNIVPKSHHSRRSNCQIEEIEPAVFVQLDNLPESRAHQNFIKIVQRSSVFFEICCTLTSVYLSTSLYKNHVSFLTLSQTSPGSYLSAVQAF